jgi:tetratricopeptide (TPR) repeat protein
MANTLNPDATAGWYQSALMLENYRNGHYKEALEILRQDTDRNSVYVYIAYIPVYGQLGLRQEALGAWRRLVQEQGAWTAESFETWWRLWNYTDRDMDKLREGVRKSGVVDVSDVSPETPPARTPAN